MDIMFSLSETCYDSATTGLGKKKKSTLSRLLVNDTPVTANFFLLLFF